MNKSRLTVTSLVAGVLVSLSVLPATAMAFRCGNELVQEGDRKYEVRQTCGHPDHTEKQADAFLEGLGYVGEREVWFYDPGPNGFVRKLTFRKGQLAHIETVSRSGEADGGDCDPHFIDKGLTRYELLAECGEPAAKDSWHEVGRFKVAKHEIVSGKVKVEEWTYDFGPGQFTRHVRIINGTVVKVETGDRGD